MFEYLYAVRFVFDEFVISTEEVVWGSAGSGQDYSADVVWRAEQRLGFVLSNDAVGLPVSVDVELLSVRGGF